MHWSFVGRSCDAGFRRHAFAHCATSICIAIVVLWHAARVGQAADPDQSQPTGQGQLFSEFLNCESLPRNIRELADRADRAEREAEWNKAFKLRQEIETACKEKFGSDDWRVVEAGWRLSLMKWVVEAPDSHGKLLLEFRETASRRDALVAVGETLAAVVLIKASSAEFVGEIRFR